MKNADTARYCIGVFHKILPAMNQIETHLFCQREKEHQWMEKYKVQHIAYAPLVHGYRNEMFSMPQVAALAEKYEKPPAQILLRFLTQQSVIVIPKSAHEERIKENFTIFDFLLKEDEMEA